MGRTGNGHTRRAISAALVVVLCLTVLQQGAMIASGQITESFETGFGDWVGDWNYDPRYFGVSISGLYAFDGSFSVKLQAHGLPTPPYPKMSVWTERTVQAPPSTWLNVGLTFQLYSESPLDTPREVLAYIGNDDPEDYPDFAVVGQTDQIAGWCEYSHSDTFMSGPTGQIYVALGFYNHMTVLRSYYVDLVQLTGVSDDFTPPTISNLRPVNQSIVSANTPAIGASYTDDSGIDVSSVLLKVDSVDITASATVTAFDVTYTPTVSLSEGVHNIYLKVSDNTANHNEVVEMWWFIVDTLAPTISNLQPTNHSAIGDTTPTIGAGYSDDSGIDAASVILEVDSVDVTASVTVTASDVAYTPALPLSEGPHNVHLEVKDHSTPQNTATKTWWFVVDTQPPIVTNLQPANRSATGDTTPVISASYNDVSGIDISSVILTVDAIDVTGAAVVTPTDVTYVPAVPLSEGTHNIYLEVGDNSAPQNRAWKAWLFSVDTLPPTITNLQPIDQSIVGDSKPVIGASYGDVSGIDVGSVFLQVNGIDVTTSATVTSGDVTYVPTFPLWQGAHNVYLEVMDNSSPQNTAIEMWSFTVDTVPPVVMNMQPANQSTIGDSTPDISASYTDDSGIDISGVLLKVDSIDMTAQATIGANQMTYAPMTPLSEGLHNVYLEVKDYSTPQNTALETWWFTVDTLPPIITNLQPVNESTIGDTAPLISASYSDVSGIDVGSVILRVDLVDVTATASVTPSGVAYTPIIPLWDGVHNVYLEVSDNSAPENKAVKTWWFAVDIQPPIITDLQPANQSIMSDSMPIISASYSDDAGIDVDSVMLKVDTVDITGLAMVTPTGVLYIPSTPLADGVHNVHLSVADIDFKVSTASWSFAVDGTPPTSTLTILPPVYEDLEGGKTYVSSSTQFNLTSDDGTGIGAQSIWYLFHTSDEPEPGYNIYTSEFAIPTSKGDGLIFIKYKSMDALGNEESVNIREVYLDNTSPGTSVVIEDPSYTDSDIIYVASSTPISFSSDDGAGSGSASTYYSVVKGGIVEVDWTQYTIGSISLSGGDGQREIRFRSVDNLGNEEAEVIEVVYLDNTPPDSSIAIEEPSHTDSGIAYVTFSTAISFSSDDGTGSGTATSWYTIFEGGTVEVDWTQYTTGFIYVSGEDGQREIRFRSTDNLGNEEVDVIEEVYLDETPATSLIPDYDAVNVNYINSSLSTIAMTASDGTGSGVGLIGYGLDDPNCPDVYTGPLVSGTMSEGEHRIYYKSIDKVGNEETVQYITIFLDTTPPVANASDDVGIVQDHAVKFDGSGSDDGPSGSGIVQYTWTFVYRGSIIALDGVEPQFVFEDRDTYVVTLIVRDRAGNVGTDTMTVTVITHEVAGEFPWWVIILLLIVIVLLLLVFLMLRKKKEEEEESSEEANVK